MWFFIHISAVVFIIIIIYKFLYIISIDSLIIFVKSRYSICFFISSVLFVLFSLLNISLLTRYGWFYKKFLTDAGMKRVRYGSAFIFLLLILASIYYSEKYQRVLNGELPDFADQYRYSAGPFVQFGPIAGGEVISVSSSMVVWWFTPVKSGHTAYIKFGTGPLPDAMETAIEELNGDGEKHTVVLKGLKPMTRYYYRVPDLDQTVYSFTTGTLGRTDTPYHVLCTGDVRNSKGVLKSFYSEVNLMADAVYSRERISPAFKIVLGDLTRHGKDYDSWNLYFTNEKIHSPVYPVMPVMGNHEMYEDYGGNYNYLFSNQRYYSYTYSNAVFIHINNYDGFLGTLGREQLDYLKKKLNEHYRKKWIIVSLHEPVLSTGDYNMNELLISQLFQLFRDYRVDLVLAGHDHHYDSFHVDRESPWGGTLYIVNGGGGDKVDSFIMRRDNKRWKSWYHDRNSPYGLYQDDEYTVKYHLYGELSWGFVDIEIGGDRITTSYYRWIDIEDFLARTGQRSDKWDITPVPLTPARMVHRVSKTRDFRAALQH